MIRHLFAVVAIVGLGALQAAAPPVGATRLPARAPTPSSVAPSCFALAPSPHQPWRIMPFGDSITVGQTWPVAAADGGWRTRLAPMIKDTYVYVGTQNSFGAHEGHGGWRTDQLAAIATTAVTTSAPTHVLLMAGTNDIHQGLSATTAIASFDNLLSLTQAAAPSATIIIGQIPYVLTWSADQRAAADAYNAHLATLGNATGRVKVVDMRGVHISGDNVHPDAAGYLDMATRWLPFLPGHPLRATCRAPLAPRGRTRLGQAARVRV